MDTTTKPTETQLTVPEPESQQKALTTEADAKRLKEVINTFILGNKLNEKLTKEQIDLCMQTALSFHLNPLKREIHFVPRAVKTRNAQGYWTDTGRHDVNIIVGYEVYIKRAEATGRLDGWGVKLEKEGNELKAVITIHKKGWNNPFVHEVYLSEAQQDNSPVWKKMPRFQLKKVAISQGFRLAFPDELGGMPYIPEEIGIGDLDGGHLQEYQPKESIAVQRPQLISKEKAKILADLFKLKGKRQDATLEYFKVKKLEELTVKQANAVMTKLSSFPDADEVIDVDPDQEVDIDEADEGIKKMKEEAKATA